MLAEGTLKAVSSLSVAKPTTSLPFPSRSNGNSLAPARKEVEGGAFAERRASDSDVVSLATDDAPNAEATQEANPNSATASSGGSQDVTNRQALDNARATEEKRLEKLTKELNEKLNENLTIRFGQDEDSGENIVQLIEKKTGDVVRQFPPQEILEFRERFKDYAGLLFNQDA